MRSHRYKEVRYALLSIVNIELLLLLLLLLLKMNSALCSGRCRGVE